MSITIENSALKSFLYGILSCQCPVTEETEIALFLEYNKVQNNETVPVSSFLDIADKNPVNTPLHLLLNFCAVAQDNPESFHISFNDVLRYFSSIPHFSGMVRAFNPLKVWHTPSFIVAHMLLPVSPVTGEGDGNSFIYKGPGGAEILYTNVFVPSEFQGLGDGCYALHFGTILGPLSGTQKTIVEKQLARISEWSVLVGNSGNVDFCDFQTFSDYRKRTEERFRRNGR